MKMTTAIVVSLVATTIGLIIKAPFLWIPISLLFASIIDLKVRDWVMSDTLGRNREASSFIKLIFMLLMTYASWGQFLCVGLVIYWFVK